MKAFWTLLASWGPAGLLLLSFVESLGIPNPGFADSLVVLLTIARPEGAAMYVTLATLGSLAGSIVFFEIMRRGGEKLLAKYSANGAGARFRSWFQRYGLATVFVAALVPIPVMPLKVFAACAGAMGVPRARYIGVMIAARIPRYAGLAYLGMQVGENWQGWIRSHMWHIAVFAAVLLAGLFWLMKLMNRERVAE